MDKMLLVILLIIAYALLACVKLFLQSRYSKSRIHSLSDTLLFWLFIFFVIGVSFIPFAIVNKEFRWEILIYGIFAGFFTVGFQLFYTLALKEGPIGLSAFLTAACSVVYIVYSIIVFNEPFSVFKGIAIALFVGALAFNVKKDPKKNINLKWGILIFITCIFLIGNSIVNKYFAHDFLGKYKTGYLAIQYLFSFALAGIILIPLISVKKTRPSLKMDKWYFVFGAAIGVVLIACVFLNQWTTSIADMSFFTPIRGALCMVLTIFEGWLLYKEKPTALQWAGIACGIGATVLINF